jgi:hypothetical protein
MAATQFSHTPVAGATNIDQLQEAIGMYVDEEYTSAKQIINSGIITNNPPQVDPNTETYIGQMRWFKPLSPKVNVVSLTDSADGEFTNYESSMAKYIKTVRSNGGRKLNMAQVVTQQDGLQKLAKDFVQTRTDDQNQALFALLKGVALSEIMRGAGSIGGAAGLGGQTFDTPTSLADSADYNRYGFYVDLGASQAIVDASAATQGAARAEGFLQAIGKAWKDLEDPYYYLTCSPRLMASLRSANLVDSDRVTDGEVDFETIFQGKFRLLPSRESSSNLSLAIRNKIATGAGADITGPFTSFVMRAGSLLFTPLSVPDDIEIDRKASSFKGGGTTDLWYRWGYIYHPTGYSWDGPEDAFASNASYKGVKDHNSTLVQVEDAAFDMTNAAAAGLWARKATSVLNLGILPIFHS